jgi:hypothetical protein
MGLGERLVADERGVTYDDVEGRVFEVFPPGEKVGGLDDIVCVLAQFGEQSRASGLGLCLDYFNTAKLFGNLPRLGANLG